MEPVVRPKQIQDLIDHRPFRPFRIYMSDGSQHVVARHDLVFLTRDALIVGVLEEGDDLPDRATYFDTVHITRVEPVEQERPAE